MTNKVKVSQTASKIADYFQCQRKYLATHVQKIVPFIETPETLKGKEIHSLLEGVVKTGDISKLQSCTEICNEAVDFMNRIIGADGVKYPEMRFGITSDWEFIRTEQAWDKQPDGNLFLITGAIDLLIENGEYSTLIDYKTGKDYKQIPELSRNIQEAVSSKSLQLDLYAMVEFLRRPECNYVKGMYYFTETDTNISLIYSREKDFARLLEYISSTVFEINEKIKEWKFNSPKALPSPTKLCNWCGYKDRCEDVNKS